MDRINELIKCIAHYNKQFSEYAIKYFDPKYQSEHTKYFHKMHKKHYVIEFDELLNKHFDRKDIDHIKTCLYRCFKFPFDDYDHYTKKAYDKYTSSDRSENITLDDLCYGTQHEFYENMINNSNNSYNYTEQLAESESNKEILKLAAFQLEGFNDDKYKLFKQCIDQFNNI